jgi:uncharacterized membrane protein
VSEQAYRQRLEADLLRWQTEGVIAPAAREAIRATFKPLPAGIDLATVVAILGGLLIAAAFLAFIAANWTEIHRPLRFLILLAGIVGAYGAGTAFAYRQRPYLADLSVTVGCIIFGAAIALVGQMYHLGGDFAGGMALWATGSMVAAIVTQSRGALAVALVAGCIWHGGRTDELAQTQLPFAGFCIVAAALAVIWNSVAARHLAALAALGWWVGATWHSPDDVSVVAFGASMVLGLGLALASGGPQALSKFGLTLSTYGAFAFAISLSLLISDLLGRTHASIPLWLSMSGALGILLAFAAVALTRRPGPAFAGISLVLGMIAVGYWVRPATGGEPWLSYATALASMLCLIISGMLDDVRPRVVAGWLGLAGVIAAITWAVKGSLLRRAAFLAIAGSIAVATAYLLARIRKEPAV